MGKLNLFVVLVSFWTILSIFSFMFGDSLINGQLQELKPDVDVRGTDKWLGGLFETLEDIPVVNSFLPLMKVLTFQYSDNIPTALVLILDATLIFTGYIFVELLFSRG